MSMQHGLGNYNTKFKHVFKNDKHDLAFLYCELRSRCNGPSETITKHSLGPQHIVCIESIVGIFGNLQRMAGLQADSVQEPIAKSIAKPIAKTKYDRNVNQMHQTQSTYRSKVQSQKQALNQAQNGVRLNLRPRLKKSIAKGFLEKPFAEIGFNLSRMLWEGTGLQ